METPWDQSQLLLVISSNDTGRYEVVNYFTSNEAYTQFTTDATRLVEKIILMPPFVHCRAHVTKLSFHGTSSGSRPESDRAEPLWQRRKAFETEYMALCMDRASLLLLAKSNSNSSLKDFLNQ
jgi:hypothetical protein